MKQHEIFQHALLSKSQISMEAQNILGNNTKHSFHKSELVQIQGTFGRVGAPIPYVYPWYLAGVL